MAKAKPATTTLHKTNTQNNAAFAAELRAAEVKALKDAGYGRKTK